MHADVEEPGEIALVYIAVDMMSQSREQTPFPDLTLCIDHAP